MKKASKQTVSAAAKTGNTRRGFLKAASGATAGVAALGQHHLGEKYQRRRLVIDAVAGQHLRPRVLGVGDDPPSLSQTVIARLDWATQ